MDYYKKIKNELINNEVYKKVKDYSKNRSDLNTYYKVGKQKEEWRIPNKRQYVDRSKHIGKFMCRKLQRPFAK